MNILHPPLCPLPSREGIKKETHLSLPSPLVGEGEGEGNCFMNKSGLKPCHRGDGISDPLSCHPSLQQILQLRMTYRNPGSISLHLFRQQGALFSLRTSCTSCY